MMMKRSQHELCRLVEHAVADLCGLPRKGLWFCVEHVETKGRPLQSLQVWATLHFLPEGSPFCCGEPGCHLGLYGTRLAEVSDHVRRALRLRHTLEVDVRSRLKVVHHPEIDFHYGLNDPV